MIKRLGGCCGRGRCLKEVREDGKEMESVSENFGAWFSTWKLAASSTTPTPKHLKQRSRLNCAIRP